MHAGIVALLSSSISPLFIHRFRNNFWYFTGYALLIQCNESEIRTGAMCPDSGEQAFRFHAHADLHRTPRHVVDRRFEYDEVSNIDGGVKVNAVDRCGYDIPVGVAEGRYGSGIVN